MAKRLIENLNASYIGAAGHLQSRGARKKIVAYVEGYDDILFWRRLLNEVEKDDYYFEVMLPSHTALVRGKKSALMNTLGHGLGSYMIACVDADYDYLMQGDTEMSRVVCLNPYVFHTYAYAIENYQCYAPSLHEVCVMATLNDHHIFDFEKFMSEYSRIVFPLFVWSIWCYRNKGYKQFSMADLCTSITPDDINLQKPEAVLKRLSHCVNAKIARLQKQFPQAKGSYQALREKLKQLGVTPETTYLYLRGHDVFDKVVSPIVDEVCSLLRREREHEIHRLAQHSTQCMNELAGYQHSTSAPEEMLRKHSFYKSSPLYQKIVQDLRNFMEHISEGQPNSPTLSEHQRNNEERRPTMNRN